MPNDRDYVLETNAGLSRIRVQFSTDGMLVSEFLVQLETSHNEVWKPVRRYDDHHGRPHIDYLDQRGREYNKEWLDMDRNSALTFAIQDFKENGERYIIEFLKDDTHE